MVLYFNLCAVICCRPKIGEYLAVTSRFYESDASSRMSCKCLPCIRFCVCKYSANTYYFFRMHFLILFCFEDVSKIFPGNPFVYLPACIWVEVMVAFVTCVHVVLVLFLADIGIFYNFVTNSPDYWVWVVYYEKLPVDFGFRKCTSVCICATVYRWFGVVWCS